MLHVQHRLHCTLPLLDEVHEGRQRARVHAHAGRAVVDGRRGDGRDDGCRCDVACGAVHAAGFDSSCVRMHVEGVADATEVRPIVLRDRHTASAQ